MRKAIIGSQLVEQRTAGDWLDLEQMARVEVTSEDPAYPIEAALTPDSSQGWRASESGEQCIRIFFDAPLTLHRIQLVFRETEHERTQEFTVRWTPASGGDSIEVARQQWNFSPAGSTVETENFNVNLAAVASLELNIRPDIGHKPAVASLAALRLS